MILTDKHQEQMDGVMHKWTNHQNFQKCFIAPLHSEQFSACMDTWTNLLAHQNIKINRFKASKTS